MCFRASRASFPEQPTRVPDLILDHPFSFRPTRAAYRRPIDTIAIPDPARRTERGRCAGTAAIGLPRNTDDAANVNDAVINLFRDRGWTPFEFQSEAWHAYLDGRSGLINAPTGVGKTMAAWLGPVIEGLRERPETDAAAEQPRSPRFAAKKGRSRASREHNEAEPARVLWVTPLRALAADTAQSLLEPVRRLGLPWTVQMRTGDTAQSVKKRQKERLPTALVTTPESLTLLLSYPDARDKFASLRCVVVDEWHELIGSKRGVQMELALARLRTWLPALRTWGISATLGNLEQARDVLLGASHDPARAALVRGQMAKDLDIRTLIPPDIERFPWSGHLGTRSVSAVVDAIEQAGSTLLFTNTRSQAELWFRRLFTDAPHLIGAFAIHHGSLDRDVRARVESLLAAGKLKAVVCTSSLDLGVDFTPVDQVVQVGSPKGIARLVQRAGRSGHQPGATSRVIGVPTHAFELVEFAAAREAAAAGRIESRPPVERPVDVLVQHLVTIACGGGFVETDLLREVRSTYAFRNLSDADWSWAMDFVTRGGPALTAYPHYARIRRAEDGGWTPASDRMARMHRMSIGTISAESSMSVRYLSGRTLGHIEEDFIGRLRAGSRFVFAGKILELVRVREMTAFVQRSRLKSGLVPRWDGGRFSLSTQLAAAVRGRIDDARRGVFDGPEMQAARPLFEMQARLSIIPAPHELLVESISTEGVHNSFIFPFEGRLVHEGLGALLAYRLSRLAPLTVTTVANDYGIGLRSSESFSPTESQWQALFSADGLVEDLLACVNASTMSRRQFRDIARISGLVLQGFPGAAKPARHLQASSEMFFDVFEEFDPDNMLLEQARREVLESQLELGRLRMAMQRLSAQRLVQRSPAQLTPLAFPIWAEHLRATTLSSESWSDMVAKMALRLEESAADGAKNAARTSTRRSSRDRGRVGR